MQKKTVWFIGVEVEQETSAPPPKKNPGSAPEFIYSFSSVALTVNRVIYMPLFSFKQSKFVLICSGLQSIDISKKKFAHFIGNYLEDEFKNFSQESYKFRIKMFVRL